MDSPYLSGSRIMVLCNHGTLCGKILNTVLFHIHLDVFVLPGFVDTEMMRAVPEKILLPKIEAHPMQRLGKPEEIASLVVFLCSDESSYVSGECIICSGGSIIH